ncbi:MAG: HD domain-containing protein [Syntrophomonas sp.]|nr:HD domain-containing protein [Syntrophomonas sp.]
MKNFYQFRDPIHGMIQVSGKEEQLIQLPGFQRLRYIRQLGTSYLVYHGAEHTRFGHSLGVMHLVGNAIDSLWQRGYLSPMDEQEYLKVRQIGRLVGLLHDVGHGPFSHVGEDSGLYPKIHDFNGELASGHEVFTRKLILEHFGNKIDSLFADDGITKEDIVKLQAGWVTEGKYQFIKDLISGQIDTDRMDYLLRDSYYCGVQYGKYDLTRILDTLCIHHSDEVWQLGIESNGVHALEEFIFARYWMFLQVYFHKTRRIYDYYLTEFLRESFHRNMTKTYPSNIDDYLKWTDSKVLELLKQFEGSSLWAKRICSRTHIKEAFISKPLPEDSEDEQKDELGRIAWVIEQVEDNYNTEVEAGLVFWDQAKTSGSKFLIDIPQYVPDTQEDDPKRLFAMPVIDKLSGQLRPIQEYSPMVQSITGKKINLLRVYADDEIKEQVCEFCNKSYYSGYNSYIEEMNQKRVEYERLRVELAHEEAAKKSRKDKVK